MNRLKTERSHVSEIIRQEFADRIVATEEDAKRVRMEMSEMKARHRHEMEKARDDVVRALKVWVWVVWKHGKLEIVILY